MKQYLVLLLLLANTICLKIKNTDSKSNLSAKAKVVSAQAKSNDYSTSIYKINNQNIIINTSLLKDNENLLLKEYILHYIIRLLDTFEKYNKLVRSPIQNHSFPERITESPDNKKLFPVNVVKRDDNLYYGKKENYNIYNEGSTNRRYLYDGNRKNSEYYSGLEPQHIQIPYQFRQTYSNKFPR